MAFIKSGNLSMVHALIEHYGLGLGFLSLRPEKGDNFKWSDQKDVSRDTWNPLVYAISYK